MNTEFRRNILPLLDVLMSEYGWTLEYCLALPGDVIVDLYKTINARQLAHAKLWVKLIGAAVGAGFSGKIDKLDKIFGDSPEVPNQELDRESWKAQLKGLWLRLGRNAEEFEQKWATDERIEM